MGLAIALAGAKRLVAVTLLVGLVAGLGTWLTAPANTETIGASGLVFGYATYLMTRFFFSRSVATCCWASACWCCGERRCWPAWRRPPASRGRPTCSAPSAGWWPRGWSARAAKPTPAERWPGCTTRPANFVPVAPPRRRANGYEPCGRTDRPEETRVKTRAAVALLTSMLAIGVASAPAQADNFRPGARSLGDPILPQLGNGGYDARAYDIDLDYDPVANRSAPRSRP